VTAPPPLQLLRASDPDATGAAAEPIRWGKIMTARARIAAGYYDRPDILERLADAVLEELQHS
jgi:hypothetical protein